MLYYYYISAYCVREYINLSLMKMKVDTGQDGKDHLASLNVLTKGNFLERQYLEHKVHLVGVIHLVLWPKSRQFRKANVNI